MGKTIVSKYEFGNLSIDNAKDPTKINAIGIVGCTLEESGDGYASVARYKIK